MENLQQTNENENEIEDRKKVREFCSKCIVELFDIMNRLEAIRDVVTGIDIPQLSTYRKITIETVEESVVSVPKDTSVATNAVTFKPAKKQDITSIAMALAKNLDLQLKKEKEEGKTKSS